MSSVEAPSEYHVCLVAGARPNFVKIAPLMRAIQRASGHAGVVRLVPHLVHTGQHYDRQLSGVFFDDLGIPEPEVNLEVGSGTQAQQTAAVMTAFEQYASEAGPEMIVVVGDVNSTLACSLVAAKMGISLAHVEAGLRSFDRTMPEEINRIVTDRLSDLLFVSEESGVDNLRREGVDDGKIHFVGNVMIDTLLEWLSRAEDAGGSRAPGCPYGLITLHRPSNVDDRATLSRLLCVLKELSAQLPLLFPVHPRTAARLSDFGLTDALTWVEDPMQAEATHGLLGIPSLGYVEFLSLMRGAQVVLTDSGGIQEETTALGVPCITLRENTERPVTLTLGTNCLVGTCESKIRAAFAGALAAGHRDARMPPLWDGKAAERIVAVILREAERSILCSSGGDDGEAEVPAPCTSRGGQSCSNTGDNVLAAPDGERPGSEAHQNTP